MGVHDAGPFAGAPHRGPRLIAFPNAATGAFLDRPALLHGESARAVLEVLADQDRNRRLAIEATLTRLEDLRERLIAKLDALDPDPDLEPVLSCLEAIDQRKWWKGANDDRECGDDDEPSLGSTNAIDQRLWWRGGSNDAEAEHDGREPECDDEGAQCDDEGFRCDDEPDAPDNCNWPNEGDQSKISCPTPDWGRPLS